MGDVLLTAEGHRGWRREFRLITAGQPRAGASGFLRHGGRYRAAGPGHMRGHIGRASRGALGTPVCFFWHASDWRWLEERKIVRGIRRCACSTARPRRLDRAGRADEGGAARACCGSPAGAAPWPERSITRSSDEQYGAASVAAPRYVSRNPVRILRVAETRLASFNIVRTRIARADRWTGTASICNVSWTCSGGSYDRERLR